MPRFTLTNAQKLKTHQEFQNRKQNGGSISQSALAIRAGETLKIRLLLSNPVTSRLLWQRTRLVLENRPIQRKRNGAQPHLERALADWIQSIILSRQCITGGVIRQKAARLQDEVNLRLSESEKRRWRLVEGGDKVPTTVEPEFTSDAWWKCKCRPGCISSLVSRFAEKHSAVHSWWCLECRGDTVFLSNGPDRTISDHAVAGRKKEKFRLTVFVCSNTSGKGKRPLLTFGKARHPRSFQKKQD